MEMGNECPNCGGPISCLGGCSAHEDNWYCNDVETCGWQAWSSKKTTKDMYFQDPLPEDRYDRVIRLMMENGRYGK